MSWVRVVYPIDLEIDIDKTKLNDENYIAEKRLEVHKKAAEEMGLRDADLFILHADARELMEEIE